MIVVLALGAALRLSFSVGPAASDDMRYMRAAHSVASGSVYEELDHACVRAAFILWLALWLKLGAGVAGLVLSDVVLSLGIMLAVYWLAAKWAGRKAGLLAMLWLACFPLELLCSGLVVSDHLGLLLGLLAAGLGWDALTAEPRRGGLKLLLAGACTGAAVSAKEVYVILPIVFALWTVWQVRPLKPAVLRVVLLGALSLGFFSLEHIFFLLWTGDSAYRYHAVSSVYDAYPPIAGLALRDVVFYILQILANPGVSGVYGWVMLAALIMTFGKLGDRHFVLLWTLCFFLFMQYGSTSLDRYQPLPKQWRYMHPMVILMFIPLGRWMLELLRTPAIGRCGTCLLTAGLLVCGVLAANDRAAERLYSEDSLRCLAIAREQQRRGTVQSIALPKWVARGTALELSHGIDGWAIVDLSDDLQRQEAELLARRGAVLLVPEIMWYHKRADPHYGAVKRRLGRSCRTEPITDWRSPLDRVAAKLAALKPFAQRTVIAHYYYLEPGLTEWQM